MIVKKQTTIFNLLLMIASVTVTTNVFGEKPLEALEKKILQDFVHQPTDAIMSKIEKEKPIEEEFQQFLDKDALMQGALDVHQRGASGEKLRVIQLSKKIDDELEAKNKKIEGEAVSATRKELFFGEVAVIGVILVIGSFAHSSGGASGAALGGVMTIGGAGGCYHYGNKADAAHAHLKAGHTMKEKWNRSFVRIVDKKADKKQ